MKLRRMGALGLLLLTAAVAALPAGAAPTLGKLSGVVVDPSGVPQMGASVSVLAEAARNAAPLALLTNDRGVFLAERLLPGFYSVRVTLAGFLPAVERHVRVESSLTTVLKIELDSVLTSFDRLRRRPNQEVQSDEWAWVLRTSAVTRPVLRVVDGEVVLQGELSSAEKAKKNRSHGRVELSSGAPRPGSVSNVADAPSSAFAYDQPLGRAGRLLLAGQFSYERSVAAGLATTWVQDGPLGRGSETTVVLRQARLDSDQPAFRGVRAQHESRMKLGERFSLEYGAEYILVGLGRPASSLRPYGDLVVELSPTWRAAFTLASRPWSGVEPSRSIGTLESALAQLDAFPAVLVRDGRPVLAGGWHEEISLEHALGPNATLVASVFRDRSRHTAVFGRNPGSSPEYFRDSFSQAFSYDGGEMNSWGTRLAYRQRFSPETEVTLVYALAGALLPDAGASGAELRETLHARNCHSLAARVATRFPLTHTHLTASYKWVRGAVVSRQDAYGEIAYQLDPHLNLSFRQPLPTFLFPGKIEALADIRNLLANGYVPVNTAEGQVLLVPAFRTFRGGFSFQF